ncbi:hypothetical protein DFH29DRAFT_1002496 [Suillus ampliporus]|nr:hypothetical protein DFH29DRAFT_1002496 [Suillus ampliporus]
MPSLPGYMITSHQKQASCQRFSLLIPHLFLPLLPLFHMLSLFRLIHHLPILPLNVLLFHMLPLLAHIPTPNTQCPPVPLLDAASTSMVPSQLDVPPASTPPSNSSLSLRGGRGTGHSCLDGIQMMLAQRPGTDVIRREIVHDLEGYYYVILTLAFMFDVPYTLKKVPNTDMASGAEMWLHRWLENTIEMEIWQEAVEKQHYLGTDAGFSMVEGLLGEEWVIEPVKTMLKEMREHLFTNAAPTHSGMLDIIINALVKICTNPDLAHLCQPQQMTMEWAKATGGNGIASRSSILPAL